MSLDDDEDKLAPTRSMEEVAAFRVQTKLRNNRLIKAREELGYTTAAAAAKALDLSYATLVAYEGLKESPWNRKNGWKPLAEKIAASYGYACEELWPDVVARVTVTRADYEVSDHVIALAQPPDHAFEVKALRHHVDEVLETLTPREEAILRMRFGLSNDPALYEHDKTAVETGRQFEISSARILQIEGKALRKLRHPSRSKRLAAFAHGATMPSWTRAWIYLRKNGAEDETTTYLDVLSLWEDQVEGRPLYLPIRCSNFKCGRDLRYTGHVQENKETMVHRLAVVCDKSKGGCGKVYPVTFGTSAL